jgi:hypothetical protein
MAEPKDENPMIKLWHQLDSNNLLVHCLYEIMWLAKQAIVQVIGSVEDERTFSTLTFMKSKIRKLLVEHLDIAICMFTQDFFTKKTFPFQVAMDWNDKTRLG